MGIVDMRLRRRHRVRRVHVVQPIISYCQSCATGALYGFPKAFAGRHRAVI